jgi:murein DD-endopeptidase MepM/ murein hydrolase activator NlpD
MRRAVAAVAAAGLVGAAAADAQEPSAPPAPSTAADPAPTGPTQALPTPPVSPPPAAPPAPPPTGATTPEAPDAAGTDGEGASGTAANPERSTAARRRANRARERAARERRRAERRAERRAKRRAERRAAIIARKMAAEATAKAEAGRAQAGVLAPGAVLPGLTIGKPIPSFLIERFRIPPFLLSVYQAAGVEYGVRWEILAAINEIETDYGRNLNVSSAGAQGWMQFMPATWRTYGVDANDDGRRDPYNPVDAIFAAARYLKAGGYERDVRGAIFAYNHADWYVDSVLARAKLISLLPGEFVGSLTGLTEGRFPVAAEARYATRATKGALSRRGKRRVLASEGSSLRRELNVRADPGSPVVAVQDGKVTRIGNSPRLGRFLQLRDVYGNTYTYANLGSVAKTYLTPRRDAADDEQTDRAGAGTAAGAEAGTEAEAGIPSGRPLRAAGQTGPRATEAEPTVVDPDARARRLVIRPGRAPSTTELLTEAPSVAPGPRTSELRRNLEAARAAGVAPAVVPRGQRLMAVAPRTAAALRALAAAQGAPSSEAAAAATARKQAQRAAKPGAKATASPGGAAAERLLAAQRSALKSAVLSRPAPPLTRAPGPPATNQKPAPPAANPKPAPPAANAAPSPPAAIAAIPAPSPQIAVPVAAAPLTGPWSRPLLGPMSVLTAPADAAAPAPRFQNAAVEPASEGAPESKGDDDSGVTVYTPYQRRLLGGLKRKDVRSRRLRVGSPVVGGTILGRIGKEKKPHLRFRIRPAGKGTPLIDPTPLLDGWRLLESSAVYRSTGRSALRPGGSSVGRILLESKDRLVRRVLTSPDIELYACGRRDVAAGLIDRRVLATLAFLAEEGLKPTVSSLLCGHGRLTSSGNVSEHTSGSAVDISSINGVPIQGHQGAGSVTEQAIRRLLTLQGTMKPHQIISLLSVPGTDNTLALPDHADHIHVGWTARPRTTGKDAATIGGALRGSDWNRLMARLNVIENPLVSATPSDSALPVRKKKGR